MYIQWNVLRVIGKCEVACVNGVSEFMLLFRMFARIYNYMVHLIIKYPCLLLLIIDHPCLLLLRLFYAA